MSNPIWFWQRIVTPHMAKLARSLAKQGWKVVYVAETMMSEERQAQGWEVPSLDGVELKYLTIENVRDLVETAGPEVHHLCQGVRNNGLISGVQRELKRRGIKSWIMMETVEDIGIKGIIKRLEYARLFLRYRKQIRGVLAIGHKTEGWLMSLGLPSEKVFPFAYFLDETPLRFRKNIELVRPFRFAFVGQFIERKRLDLLIHCLAEMKSQSFEVCVVGSGPLGRDLERLARSRIGSKQLQWMGKVPQSAVPELLLNTDCLVLPSSHDGWGAVVSEALLNGTHVICSDACGSADVTREIQGTGVFPKDNAATLRRLLMEALARGVTTIESRMDLASKSSGLGAEAGASYLAEILNRSDIEHCKPVPPWKTPKTA